MMILLQVAWNMKLRTIVLVAPSLAMTLKTRGLLRLLTNFALMARLTLAQLNTIIYRDKCVRSLLCVVTPA